MLVVLCVLLSVVLSGCAGQSGTSGTASPYGTNGFHPHFPSFLPKNTLNAKTDQVLTGTAARPALTSEGDAVEVVTPHWSVRAVVSGPIVPGEGLPYQTPYTTCTWTVTMSRATGRVPISLADFISIDHVGAIYHLTFVEGQPVPPAILPPGQRVTFQVRAYELLGEGVMRWAPIDEKIVAMWDYEVEND